MKKAISLLLIALLLFSVSACRSAKSPEITKYIPNSQAEVAVSYIYDGKANIATRQLTDTKLKSITLACIYYDITGKQIGKLKLIDCEVTDNKDITLWQSDCPELAVYIDSVVYSVTDENGTEHKAENIDLWGSSAASAFKIETYQNKLEKRLSKNAALAIENPYVKLGAVSWQDLSVTVEMELLSKDVKSVYLFALWFDAKGQPVDIQACSYCANGESMVAHINTGDNHNYIFQTPETAQSAKLIVQSVELNNGTQWINHYFYEWVLLNRYNAK